MTKQEFIQAGYANHYLDDKKAVAEYWKKRNPKKVEAIIHYADMFCRHEFLFNTENDLEQLDEAICYGDKIDWEYKPGDDQEYIYQFNRHRYFITLGQAYAFTGDEKYAKCYVDLLMDWIRENPLCEAKKNTSWRILEAGFRGEYWTKAFYYFVDSECVTDEVVDAYEACLHEHAKYLISMHSPYRMISNWGAMANAYMEANPNVKIEMVDLGSADYMTVLATELSGDGSLYELPFRNDFWVLFYNKDIFDNAGVTYPTNDMTWEEYDALAREVTSTEFGAQVYGAHYHTWRSTIGLMGVLDGAHTILDGEYGFMQEYYDMVLAQEADGVCRKYSDLKTEGLHYPAAFSSGDVAMMNMGSWYIPTLMSSLQSGDYDASLCGNWGIVKYPHAEGVEAGSTLGTITGLSVTSATEYKDEAWDFVNWASGSEGAAVMASTGNFPAVVTDDVIAQITGMEGFPTDEASKEALEVSNLYLEVPYAENVSSVNSILDTYHGMIMGGECSVEDGIASMNEEVSALN